MSTCDYPGCDQPHEARGWCQTHYARFRRTGSPERVILTPLERFSLSVDFEGPGGCWLWTGAQGGVGYGKFKIGADGQHRAHRWLYQQVVGPVAASLDLDHLCRVRHCVNPDHLEPVTRSENIKRGNQHHNWNRRTHCKSGLHELTTESTMVSKGVRYCKPCRNAKRRAQYREKRAA